MQTRLMITRSLMTKRSLTTTRSLMTTKSLMTIRSLMIPTMMMPTETVTMVMVLMMKAPVQMMKALEQMKKETAPTATTMTSKSKTGQMMTRKALTGGHTLAGGDACASNESWSVLDSHALCKRSAVPYICPLREVSYSLNHQASFWSRLVHFIPK